MINITLESPIIRTSLEHCTGFVKALEDTDNLTSLVEDIKLSGMIVRNQKNLNRKKGRGHIIGGHK